MRRLRFSRSAWVCEVITRSPQGYRWQVPLGDLPLALALEFIIPAYGHLMQGGGIRVEFTFGQLADAIEKQYDASHPRNAAALAALRTADLLLGGNRDSSQP